MLLKQPAPSSRNRTRHREPHTSDIVTVPPRSITLSGQIYARFDYRAHFHDASIADNSVFVHNYVALQVTVDEMIAFIKKQKSLLVGGPTPIVIDGHQGQYLDLSLSPTWNKACPDMNGVLSAPVLREAGNANGWDWRMSAPEKWRLILLDLGDSNVVAIIVDDSSSVSRFDELVTQAMPIVQSFTFK